MARNDDTIDPPHTFMVEDHHKPVLWLPDGTPLRRQIGFRAMQTTGTNPPLSDNVSRKPKGKGKR